MNPSLLALSLFAWVPANAPAITPIPNPFDPPRKAAVEYISHRGESADAPENTMAAFRLAWERDVDAIELDVHLSKDDRLVVIHDADTQRTCGVSLKVKDSTYDQLKGLDAGSWKDAKYAGEPLPLLEQVLETIPQGKRCFIEIKVGPEAVPALVKAIETSGKKPEQLAVISFNAETVAESKRRLPEIPAYFLSGFRRDKETGEWNITFDQLIELAKTLKADGLDLYYQGPFDRAAVEKVKSAGLGLYVWTVDDPEAARALIDLGIDGVTTNKARWLKEQVEAAQSK
ncbi:glycerophosphoryl diester phosphodiesterase [Isosphaera pallida ATCC 43644]|uniref:Glycerophosphoryl diester phosphodiesterase n=1 Tax=Isosphaera pallida (strain ATCC 43644 / DSM 9630 / IS1B) TaxID=575540 RepID=E8R4K8_ISOPI|nr:glycerophosphodiester phosphodiesterase [Isosphaera pallida]ADV60599.1 glycerophosphoryl diester phosphodiesterase [Isosphaera pallida ATCC 43644]